MSPGDRRERERSRGHREHQDDAQANRHASGRLPDRPTKPAAAATRASTPTARATMANVLLPPPPPREDFASTFGAGESDDSGPAQSTTVPSEYVCRTLKVYVFEASVEARNWKSASSSVGTLPPLQVTFSTVVFSPLPVVCASRFQPGAGT